METNRHLLIDGYNVLHQWPEGKKLLQRGQSAAARNYLAETVRVIHDCEQWRVTMVFDGQGERVEVERPYVDLTLSFVFAPRGLSADAVIEQLVAASVKPGEIVVVTLDAAERETLQVAGANVLTPEDLRQWVEQAGRRLSTNLTDRGREVESAWRRGGKKRR